MTKKLAGLFLLLFSMYATAQQKKEKDVINIPLKADNWEFKPNATEFLTYKSVPAMKLTSGKDQAVLKDFNFRDGTIEYDMEPTDSNFTAFYFRRGSIKETECFYFRMFFAGDPYKMQITQYAPFIDGVNLWDMYYHFQGNTLIEMGKWTHVKLVISGKQMRAYINHQPKPVLQVPRLEANAEQGTLAFDGKVIISNLVVKPGQTEGLSPLEGIDPEENDPRYLRKWLVGKAADFPGDNLPRSGMPAPGAAYDTITAERRGLINLTRKFGASTTRRIVWLKTNIHADEAITKKMRLGFSDDVWVFINGRLLYADKNMFGSPIMKPPVGRCSIENSAFDIPLKKGDNELLIGVANDFYGWGIIARLDDVDAIRLTY